MSSRIKNFWSKLVSYSEFVVLPHSVFALPFALSGLFLAKIRGELPDGAELGLELVIKVVLSVVFARSAAMGFNRLVDYRFDKKNPRTRNRPLITGEISKSGGVIFTLASSGLYFATVYLIGWHCFVISPFVLLILFGYSYSKRFTAASHFVLGACLGLAPAAAWYVLRPEVALVPIVLSVAVLLWVAGFDLLYSLQDQDYDREEGLHSIPAKLGTSATLTISRVSHLLAGILFLLTGVLMPLGIEFFAGVFVCLCFLAWEHSLVRKDDLSRINRAFFTMNGIISLVFLLGVLASFYLNQG